MTISYEETIKNKKLQEFMNEINADDEHFGGDYHLSRYEDDNGLSQDEIY